MKARHLFASLLAVGLGLAAPATASAQFAEDDPRFVPDPREARDPRSVERDPRDPFLDPHAVPEGKHLFDMLLAQKDQHRLAMAISENPWITLEYIHGVVQRRLAMTESGSTATVTGMAAAQEVEEQALTLAALADRALGDTRFQLYVRTMLGWDVADIQRHRVVQGQIKRANTILLGATSPDDARRAMTPLKKARETASQIGDTWSHSRALVLMGRIRAAQGSVRETQIYMEDALKVGRAIRDMDSMWEALSTLYEADILRNDFESARERLRDQYLLAQDSQDVESAESVLQQLIDLENLIRSGNAAAIRGLPTGEATIPGPGGGATGSGEGG